MFSKRLANQRRTVHSRPPRRSIRSPKQFRIQHHLDGFHTVEDIPQSSQQSRARWPYEDDCVLDAAAIPGVGDVDVPVRIFDDGGIAELTRAGFEREPRLPSLSAIVRNGDAQWPPL